MITIAMVSILFFVPACFILICMYYVYMYTIKLVYEYGYNKNVSKEESKYSDIESYEDKTALSLLMIFPYIFIVLCITALYCEVFGVHIKVTLPTIAAVFGVWAAINYTAIYKLGYKDRAKHLRCITQGDKIGRYGIDKQELLYEYKLELENMCKTLEVIISLKNSEKYLIPDTLIGRAEYLKEEMTVAIEVIDIDKEEQERIPLSTIELEIDTEKEYFKEKYFKIIEMVKSTVLDRVSKTHNRISMHMSAIKKL